MELWELKWWWGGVWGDWSPPAAGQAGFGGTVGSEAAWVPAKGSSTLAGFGGDLSRLGSGARSQQMALLNAPRSFLLCRHRSEMASPASLCSSSRLRASSSGLGAGHRGPQRSPKLALYPCPLPSSLLASPACRPRAPKLLLFCTQVLSRPLLCSPAAPGVLGARTWG